MSGKSINFEDKKINKSNFYNNKKPFKIKDIDINKILVSKKESYGTKDSSKYIIGYNDDDDDGDDDDDDDDDDVIRPLCITFSQMIGSVKYFDSNKTMSFKATDNKLLKITTKYAKNWNLMKAEFDCEPVYGDVDKYLKTKIKMYKDRVNTHFQG